MLESLFNKVAGPPYHTEPSSLIFRANHWTGFSIIGKAKKRLQHSSFPMKFAKFLRKPILKNIFEPLLLYLTWWIFWLHFLRPRYLLDLLYLNKAYITCSVIFLLTHSWWRALSYRNQSIDLRSRSMDWFLYDNGLRHERVKDRI